ncbi:MAG: hybrid sensor histidine kinase/response regulator [Chloroherpetonaceae bacterium]|nr:hybrid sensor histidine kinase/response regulator [Chloroherpetonaceae bacterium]MDW8020319.1 hybrid sensor histidine kinase/response regulator [Chloroherpetonaceae bacterium]
MKILIVDDEADFETLMRERFRKELEAGEYEFLFAQNGLQALQKLREHPDIRIVLTDINMPEMDGLTLLSKIAPHNPLLRVIVISAYGDMKNIRTAMNQGAVDFITKPVDFRDLKATVEKVALQVNAMLEAWNKNAELAEANRVLSEANKLKTELLGIAAHDLRNPVQSILGFAELIKEMAKQNAGLVQAADLQKIEHWSQRIIQSSQRMLGLIKDLLDMAALEEGQMRLRLATHDVSQIVSSVVAQNQPLARQKAQTIELSLQADCYVKADSMRLYEVVDNLLSNAIKYSPKGKTIWVSVKQHLRTDSTVPNCVRISVRDEGQGLTEDDKKRLFGKFQRLSAVPTNGECSTGLGLAIVKRVVELHGGKVWAESEGKNKGSTFFVELPACAS